MTETYVPGISKPVTVATTAQVDRSGPGSGNLAQPGALTATLVAGRTYRFLVLLDLIADATGGIKLDMSGTVTATSLWYVIQAVNNGAHTLDLTTRGTSLGTSGGVAGAVSYLARIEGVIVVNAGGTFFPRFAQNVANNGTSSVSQGSIFTVEDITAA